MKIEINAPLSSIQEQLKEYNAKKKEWLESERKEERIRRYQWEKEYKDEEINWKDEEINGYKERLAEAREKLAKVKAYKDFSALSQAEIDQFIENNGSPMIALTNHFLRAYDIGSEEYEKLKSENDEEVKKVRQMPREEIEKIYKDFQEREIEIQEEEVKRCESDIEREKSEIEREKKALKEFSIEDIKEEDITDEDVLRYWYDPGVVLVLGRKDIVDEKLDKAYNICQIAAKEGVDFQVVVADRAINKSSRVAYNYSLEQTNKLARFNEKIKPLKGQLLFGELDVDRYNAESRVEDFKRKSKYLPSDRLRYAGKDLPESQFNVLWTFEQVAKANEEIDGLVNSIKEAKLSPYEAMTFIHKHITENYLYNATDSRESSGTIMGAIIYKEIVCVGYASMVKAIVDKLDMPNLKCEYLACGVSNKNNSSDRCGHMQNLITIKDDRYDIDGVYVEDACNDSKSITESNGKGFTRGFANFLFSVNDVKSYANYDYYQTDINDSNPFGKCRIGTGETPDIIKKYGDKSKSIGEDKLKKSIFEVLSRMPQYYANLLVADDVDIGKLAEQIDNEVTADIERTKKFKKAFFDLKNIKENTLN